MNVDKASAISPTPSVWKAANSPTVLHPARWKKWGEETPGAIGQVGWTWKTGPPLPSAHPNHQSALSVAEVLGKQLDQCLVDGMTEEWNPMDSPDQSLFANNILPLGARVKGEGKVRMLVDPTLPGVNEAMADMECPLPSVEEIFEQVKPGSFLAKRDLTNGFFHCVLNKEARRYMGFRHPVSRKLARWVVLPQGTKQSPAIFCAVSTAASRIFQQIFDREGVRVIVKVYVDDFILIGDTFEDIQRAFALMDAEAALLGLVFNAKKDVGGDVPHTCIEALGLTLDSEAMSMGLPEGKRVSYLEEVTSFQKDFLGVASSPRKPVEQLVGKLIFACRVCRWGYLFVQELLDQLHPVGYPVSKGPPRVTLTEGVWHDLRFWQHALGDAFHTWMGMRQFNLGRTEQEIDFSHFTTELYTDASGTWGLGGVWGGKTLSQRWGLDRSSEHIGALELEAVLTCLKHWGGELKGRKVLVRCDNVQAVIAINKGASRKPALRDTLMHMALLGLEHQFEVKALHIKGELNPADAPSRGKALTAEKTYVFRHASLFNDPPHEVDCFADATGDNRLAGVTVHFSAENRFQDNLEDLVGKKLWASLPFRDLHQSLFALVAIWKLDPINTVVTCVVPEWTTTAWYRKLLRRQKPVFRLLKRFDANEPCFVVGKDLKIAKALPYPIIVVRLGASAPITWAKAPT